ncbi:MAG TPA: nucleotidyltransferase domain-containing protein [Kiritimatiellia bacterium]|nr:nucleotidyltransferase domain-containing protein [Kiritimatiellia bacterium]
MIDVAAQTLSELRNILEQYLPESEVFLVGSRARGTDKPYADVDLLLIRPPRLSKERRALIKSAFEESNIPYRVDLIEADDLTESFRDRLMVDAESLAG